MDKIKYEIKIYTNKLDTNKELEKRLKKEIETLSREQQSKYKIKIDYKRELNKSELKLHEKQNIIKTINNELQDKLNEKKQRNSELVDIKLSLEKFKSIHNSK